MSELDRRGALTRVRPEGRPRRHPRLLTAILAALALALALLAPAASLAGDDRSGRGGNNAAEAINEKDGSSVFDFAFSIRRVAGDVVDEQNSAVAYGSCVECRTVAIALQIVLVEGVPDTVTPTNVAIALNEECQACTTVALAYQFVVGRGGPVRFTEKGLRQLARIRREYQRLGRSGLSAEDLRDAADKLADQVAGVLAKELVPAGDDDEDSAGGDEGSRSDGGGGEDGDRRSDEGSGARKGSEGSEGAKDGTGPGAGSDREPSKRDGEGSRVSPDTSEPGAGTDEGSSGGGGSPPPAPPQGGSSSGGGESP